MRWDCIRTDGRKSIVLFPVIFGQDCTGIVVGSGRISHGGKVSFKSGKIEWLDLPGFYRISSGEVRCSSFYKVSDEIRHLPVCDP